ncbi:integrase [Plasticicumulans lactativorans]|uniref:Integrase n=1 Tax=Plasticicumulans lactativorans TaxID=1133106 RepID=A0A4R2L8I9_9GAMM|nr:site-specific integrase [Plasticicumulans lactativorans]TCO83000.1 integrase [Plasticicumulans lactativorans]
MLTDVSIRKLPPGEHPDRDGLALRVGTSGTATFRFSYRSPADSRIRRITLGRYLPANQRTGTNQGEGLTLKEARTEALRLRELVKAGIDPMATVKAEQAAAEAAKLAELRAPTFAALLAEYDERELSTKRTGADMRKLVERNALSTLGPRKVKEITRREVVLLLNDIRDAGSPATADKLTTILVRCFNYACEAGILDANPLAGIKRSKSEPRERALNDAEVRAVWCGLDTSGIHRGTVLALKLILATGQRPGEVAGLAWREIDDDVWTLPAARTKNGRAHRVPLSALALGLLEDARALAGTSAYVFPSPQRRVEQPEADRPLDRHSLSRAVLRKLEALGMPAWTPHDLRRTMRTGLAVLGIPHEIAERVVGHAQDRITATYNQHSYDREKRAALDAWGRRLVEITGDEALTPNVVALRGAA